MKVDVLPVGPPDSDSVPFAQDLAGALRKHASLDAALRCVGTWPPDGSNADIVHMVACRADDREIESIAAAANGPVIVTVIGLDPGAPERLHPGVNCWSALIDAVAARLTKACDVHARIRLSLPPVPDPLPLSRGGMPEPDPMISLVLAPDASDALVGPAIGALVDVGPRYRLRFIHAPGARAERWRSQADAQGVAGRVRCDSAADGAEVLSHIARSEAVLVSSHHVAGTWTAMAPLALGVPMLAERNPLTYDLMVRTRCVRLVRPQEPGHVAACLKAILANNIGRTEIAERARTYAHEASWAATALAYRRDYDDLVLEHSSTSRVAAHRTSLA